MNFFLTIVLDGLIQASWLFVVALGLTLVFGVLKMVTYAVFLILEDVTKLIWGVNPIYATQPYELFGNLEFAGLYYVGYDLVLIPISAAIGFAIWFGLNRTITGKIVLAVIHNE